MYVRMYRDIILSMFIPTKIQIGIAAILTMTVLTMTIRIYWCGYNCYWGGGGAAYILRPYSSILPYLLTHGQGMCTRWGGAVASRGVSGVLGLRVGLREGLGQGQVYIYTHMCIYRDIYLYLCRVANPCVQMRVLGRPVCVGYWATAIGRAGAVRLRPGMGLRALARDGASSIGQGWGFRHRSQKAQGRCKVLLPHSRCRVAA